MTNASFLQLPEEISQIVTRAGNRCGRSVEKQLLHWIRLGLLVDGNTVHEDIVQLYKYLTDKLGVENARISPRVLQQQVRDSQGTLADVFALRGEIAYQASTDNPGFIEQVHPDGSRTVGRYVDNAFIPLEDK